MKAALDLAALYPRTACVVTLAVVIMANALIIALRQMGRWR